MTITDERISYRDNRYVIRVYDITRYAVYDKAFWWELVKVGTLTECANYIMENNK